LIAVVVHRLSTVAVLRGSAAAGSSRGTHEQLMASRDGAYAPLVEEICAPPST
jgi:ABC-type transport system involved in Fe-S cluster assembly fused permease/ATPase subunit